MEDKHQEIWEQLKEVRDPEFGRSIMERELVDEVMVVDGKAQIRYHLTVPFCPKPFPCISGGKSGKRLSRSRG